MAERPHPKQTRMKSEKILQSDRRMCLNTQKSRQIWFYRNSNTKSQCLSHWIWQLHFWTLVWKTSQAASVPTNTGYTTSQSEAVWLTHKRSSHHCSFVLLRFILHLGYTITPAHAVFVIWWNLSLSASLFSDTGPDTKTHQSSLLFLWTPICLCSLLQCIFSHVRKPSEERTGRQTDVPHLHPALPDS